MNKSCHTYESVWVMSHTHRVLSQLGLSHVTVMSHVWSSDALRVLSHLWSSHISHMTETAQGCRVTSHIWMSHGTHENKSCHTYESVQVMSHIWVSHAAHTDRSQVLTKFKSVHLQERLSSCIVHIWDLQVMSSSYASPIYARKALSHVIYIRKSHICTMHCVCRWHDLWCIACIYRHVKYK